MMGVGDGRDDAMGISCTEAGATVATGGAWSNDSASARCGGHRATGSNGGGLTTSGQGGG